jgi:hypothetical protein
MLALEKSIFFEGKNKLIKLINHSLKESSSTKKDCDSLSKLLSILNQYNFENRLHLKGNCFLTNNYLTQQSKAPSYWDKGH